jgi:type IV secretion system protein VirD4
MNMSKLFKFLFGRELEEESPFLAPYQERKLINRKNTGAYVCQSGNLPADAKPNALICAPIGGGKTTGYIIPSLLSAKADRSFVVFDPGGDVLETTSGYLSEQGFSIKVLDFESHNSSEKFNPLYRVTDDMSIQKIADILVDVNYQDGKTGDPFWPDSAKHVLKLLIQAILSKSQNTKPKTLGTLYELLTMFGTEQQELDEFMITNLPEKVQLEYMAFMEAQTEKVRQTILSVCKTALSKVTTLENLISEETLHFECLRTTPTVLFVKVREDQIPFYRFIIGIFFTQLFDMLMELKKPGDTYHRVVILGDEYSSYALKSMQMHQLITVLRRRQVYLSIILQSLSQLEIIGKHESDTIIANCSTLFIFPGVGDSTASRIERMLGTYEKDGKQVKVMTAREIRMMKQNEILFIHSNYPPKVIKMKPYFEVRKFKKRVNLPSGKKGGSS